MHDLLWIHIRYPMFVGVYSLMDLMGRQGVERAKSVDWSGRAEAHQKHQKHKKCMDKCWKMLVSWCPLLFSGWKSWNMPCKQMNILWLKLGSPPLNIRVLMELWSTQLLANRSTAGRPWSQLHHEAFKDFWLKSMGWFEWGWQKRRLYGVHLKILKVYSIGPPKGETFMSETMIPIGCYRHFRTTGRWMLIEYIAWLMLDGHGETLGGLWRSK